MRKKVFSLYGVCLLAAVVAVFCLSFSNAYAFDCDSFLRIDINSASKEELECLRGIGPTYAQRIIENRPFSSLDDLQRVSGIGSVTVLNIKEQGMASVGDGNVVREGYEEEIEEEEPADDPEDGSEEGEIEKEVSVKKVSAHSSPVEISFVDDIGVVKIGAGRDRLVSVESDVHFRAYIEDESGLRRGAEFEWALGDGSVKKGREIEHRYFAPGFYSVILTVKIGGEEAVSRVEVEVIEPKMTIERADEKVIVLSNSSGGEMNLGGWEIKAGDKNFSIPQNTVVRAGGVITLPKQVTELGIEVGEEIELHSPLGGFNDSYVRVAGAVLGESDLQAVSDTAEGFREEGNEELVLEISFLREEINRLVAGRQTPAPVTGAGEEGSVTMEKAVEREEESEQQEVETQDLGEDLKEETVSANSRVETVYEGDLEKRGLWRRILSFPSMVFGQNRSD